MLQPATPPLDAPGGIDDPRHSAPATYPVELGERLFEDNVGKDVRLVASDGEERAHSLVLAATSAAFQAMFASELAEGRTKTVELPDRTQVELRFWLRLLYTGQVEEQDWINHENEVRSSYRVLLSYRQGLHETIAGEQLAQQWQSILRCTGIYRRSGKYRGAPKFKYEQWPPDLLRQGVPSPPSPSPGLYLFYDDVSEPLAPQWRIAQADLEAEPPPGEVQWVYSHPGLSISPPTGVWTRVPGDARWASPRLEDAQRDKWILDVSAVPEEPPIRLLLSALMLARKYVVEYMQKGLTKLVTDKLGQDTFEEILAAAIRMDHGPLRSSCLVFARSSHDTRARHERGGFQEPTVAFELRQLWPVVEVKRRRFL